MITVYVFRNAPPPVHRVTRDLRVVWMLEELGLAYRLHALDFERGELKAPAYVAVQPFGQIPAIDDDGFRLFESGAIVHYLADKAGRTADPAQRVLATQWSFAALTTIEPPCGELFVIDRFCAEEPWAKQRRPTVDAHARLVLRALEARVAERSYLLGDELEAPDVLMASVLREIEHSDDLVAAFPAVAAYKRRCEARPAFQKTMSEHLARLAA